MAVYVSSHQYGSVSQSQNSNTFRLRSILLNKYAVTYGDFSSDSVMQVIRNGPPKETKRLGTYKIPFWLQQVLLLKSFVLDTFNNTGTKCALVILTVPISAMYLCCRCQNCLKGILMISEN